MFEYFLFLGFYFVFTREIPDTISHSLLIHFASQLIHYTKISQLNLMSFSSAMCNHIPSERFYYYFLLFYWCCLYILNCADGQLCPCAVSLSPSLFVSLNIFQSITFIDFIHNVNFTHWCLWYFLIEKFEQIKLWKVNEINMYKFITVALLISLTESVSQISVNTSVFCLNDIHLHMEYNSNLITFSFFFILCFSLFWFVPLTSNFFFFFFLWYNDFLHRNEQIVCDFLYPFCLEIIIGREERKLRDINRTFYYRIQWENC